MIIWTLLSLSTFFIRTLHSSSNMYIGLDCHTAAIADLMITFEQH